MHILTPNIWMFEPQTQNITYLAAEQHPPPLVSLPQSPPLPEEQHCSVEAVESGSTGALMEADLNTSETSWRTCSVLYCHWVMGISLCMIPKARNNSGEGLLHMLGIGFGHCQHSAELQHGKSSQKLWWWFSMCVCVCARCCAALLLYLNLSEK